MSRRRIADDAAEHLGLSRLHPAAELLLPCDTGMPGVCAQGVTECQIGAGITCKPTIRSSPETCNNLDDDCDGVIDNGCPIDQRPLSTRTVSSTSPLYGSTSEVSRVTFTDACPDGQVTFGPEAYPPGSWDADAVRGEL